MIQIFAEKKQATTLDMNLIGFYIVVSADIPANSPNLHNVLLRWR